jgi:hypothetical protein
VFKAIKAIKAIKTFKHFSLSAAAWTASTPQGAPRPFLVDRFAHGTSALSIIRRLAPVEKGCAAYLAHLACGVKAWPKLATVFFRFFSDFSAKKDNTADTAQFPALEMPCVFSRCPTLG